MNPALDALCSPNGALHLEPPDRSEYEGDLQIDQSFLAEFVDVTELVLVRLKELAAGEGM